ncbi:dipeptidase [Evansella sp. AB-rgal1]|uniref:dipeptidase n=1 Tax=Evansella sp. AB-rgal1 TaxID=3242696 RepID=UPI00359ED23C
MRIFDLHCDALLRLWLDRKKIYTNDPSIEANYERLIQGKVKVQLFAIFLEPELPSDLKFQYALEQIDLFHTEVVNKNEKMKKITSWEDIHTLKGEEIGAVLALEGADAFGNDVMKLRTLYQLGVKSIGLTWNNANLCGDGVGEIRGGGLTEFGKEVVKLNNDYKIWTDVSHLSPNGFWDVMKLAKYPIASHSNSKTICDHVRNLTDEQAQEIFNKDGLIGLVLTPEFITGGEQATINDLIKHIDHFIDLGGISNIALGSDFDGIAYYIDGLEHSGKYQYLIQGLVRKYGEEIVNGFAYENVVKRLPL